MRSDTCRVYVCVLLLLICGRVLCAVCQSMCRVDERGIGWEEAGKGEARVRVRVRVRWDLRMKGGGRWGNGPSKGIKRPRRGTVRPDDDHATEHDGRAVYAQSLHSTLNYFFKVSSSSGSLLCFLVPAFKVLLFAPLAPRGLQSGGCGPPLRAKEALVSVLLATGIVPLPTPTT